MNVLRRPLTLNAPSRGVLPVVSDEPRELDAGRQQRERRILARDERQRPRLIAGDHLAALARIGFDQRRCRRVTSTFSDDLADRHLQIDAQARADLHLDVVDERDREAALLGGHQVDARPDRRELEVARSSADVRTTEMPVPSPSA